MMSKKIILIILILSLLLKLTGCYSMQHVSKYELINEKNENELVILTKNDSLYSFITHTVANDSIFGKGYVKSVVSAETISKNYLKYIYSDLDFSQPFTGVIAINDIVEIRQDKINWDNTAILIGVTLGFIILVWFILELDELGHSFD
jgi:hypothetical protein